jgi:hypothetical protein
LRHDALDAVAAFEDFEGTINDILNRIASAVNFKSKSDIMDDLRGILSGLDYLRKAFLDQSEWADSRWTMQNILDFERSTAVRAQLVGTLEWDVAGTLATVTFLKGIPAIVRFITAEL